MKRIWMMALLLGAVASSGAGGCDDERLAEYAKNSVDQQSKQNEQIAKQNQEVTRQNRQVAEAAQKLVEADARARQEMVIAQRTLQEGLQMERTLLDHQRQEIEEERRAIARDRYWDPIVAQAITGGAGLLACLLPLAICIYVLWNMHHDQGDEGALNELLVSELTSESPLLLPAPLTTVPGIEVVELPDDPDGNDGETNDRILQPLSNPRCAWLSNVQICEETTVDFDSEENLKCLISCRSKHRSAIRQRWRQPVSG